MEALVFTRPGHVEMQHVAEPEIGRDDVLIEVRVTGICGSELHGIDDTTFRVPPLVMGHEFCGLNPRGERVAINPIVTCGTCDRCHSGNGQTCRSRKMIGVHRAGGFAERVAVPASAVRPLPPDLPWARAGLIEPLANAVHAWRLSRCHHDAKIAVIGAGTIGLMCQLVAQAHGCEVTVADLSDARLSVARGLGARACTTSLEGEFDVVFDAVGACATRTGSLDHLRPGGSAVWLGLQDANVSFDANSVVRSEHVIVGSFAYTPREFDQAIALAATLDLSWGTGFGLGSGAEIFLDLRAGRSDITKALLYVNCEVEEPQT